MWRWSNITSGPASGLRAFSSSSEELRVDESWWEGQARANSSVQAYDFEVVALKLEALPLGLVGRRRTHHFAVHVQRGLAVQA